MSAGNFVTAKYQDNQGEIYPIRIQPETEDEVEIGATDNNRPAGAVTIPISVKVSAGKRQYGVIPRTVQFKWTGAKPAGYTGATFSLVALTETFWNAAIRGATGTYLGLPVEVISRLPENIR